MDIIFLMLWVFSRVALICLFLFGVYAFIFIETFTLKGCALYAFVFVICVCLKYWAYDNLPREMKDDW